MRGHIGLIAAAAMLSAAAAPEPEDRDEFKPEPNPEPEPTRREKIANVIPDRVSLETDSPHYFPKWSKLGVRFRGGDRTSTVEFCVSEGWIRTQIFHGGRPKMERGRFVTQKLYGPVEPYWRR
jgi:hypothetical protein